ncbi:bifunctional proline dehydrogenase/L-glutamate gamma-semialdehyde dehydrogenase PutA [Chitinibacteraceae bacterium HSL-7]
MTAFDFDLAGVRPSVAAPHDDGPLPAVDAAALEALTDALRTERMQKLGADVLFAAYPLASPAGRALMQLAEALLRIPDAATQDRLIRDLLTGPDWSCPNAPAAVRAMGAGLSALRQLDRLGAHVLVRGLLRRGLKRFGRQFVIAEHIPEALRRRQAGFRYSFDMLGEAALTTDDADHYTRAYLGALAALPEHGTGFASPAGISVKLSALDPRFERRQRSQVHERLYPRLMALAARAAQAQLPLTIDAEECDRTTLTLELLARLLTERQLAGWCGLGLAVQAYQTQTPELIAELQTLARRHGRQLGIRLVKGAYWDFEVKRAQQQGWPAYPVLTRKSDVDTQYLRCARQLLGAPDAFFPAFATHNPETLLAVEALAAGRPYEHQVLYGMGEDVHTMAVRQGIRAPCRLYAPVGPFAELLPYLVRRMLENGASQSFVHALLERRHGAIRAPYSPPHHRGSQLGCAPGHVLHDNATLARLQRALNQPQPARHATPLLVDVATASLVVQPCLNPAQVDECIGSVALATPDMARHAILSACQHMHHWQALDASRRAGLLDAAAQNLQAHDVELIQIIMLEAGKTLTAAQAEVREAIDFLHYYAHEARNHWRHQAPQPLGVVVAISPWNFPLAIFVGQIAAALAAGNVVVAKPAEETPLTAWMATTLLHGAGIPLAALQLLTGAGDIGAAMTADADIASVLFTGSGETASAIYRALATHDGTRALIAETGGINTLIADTSAHPEQLIQDVLVSAFDSAGQRCSALRVLCLPEELADTLLPKLIAAMRELRLGDPRHIATDVGPLISAGARSDVLGAIDSLRAQGLTVNQVHTAPEHGYFLVPTLVEINTLSQLPGEIFGPVLAILRYRESDALARQINALGYGLTLGLASRCPGWIDDMQHRIRAGNVYINRNQIGAVVGHQPFGGERRSGTGPKAGGPWLIWRLVRDTQPHMFTVQREIPELLLIAASGLDLDARIKLMFARSPHGLITTLPATAGEHNALEWRARGRVACLAATPVELLLQLSACMATGNRAVLPDTPSVHNWAQQWPAHIELHADPLASRPDAVLCGSNEGQAAAMRLSASDGAIIQPILPLADGSYPLYRLLREVTISTNTAVVGDIDLLAAPLPPGR